MTGYSTEFDILAALRMGAVPSEGLSRLAVGRENEIAEITAQLEYVSTRKSALKFVCGDYGSGKSFLCGLIRERAFDLGFAASSVVVSPDVPLSKLDVVVGRTLDGLRLPEKRGSCALSDLLERWLFRLTKKVATLEGISMADPAFSRRVSPQILRGIDEELSTTKGIDPGFVNGVRAYMQARLSQDHGLASDALGWLKGTENLSPSRKHALGVRGQLVPDAALNILRGLLSLLSDVGIRGFVWIIDEVETVQRLPIARLRENSYESLRVLVDNVAENAFPGLLLVVTGTPKLFEDPRYGIPSYPPLKDRISRITLPDGQHSLKQPLLALTGFNHDRLLRVGIKIREIHSRAYSWQPEQRLSDEHVARLAEMTASGFGGQVDRTPRAFLREVVHLCDMLQEHASLSVDQYLGDEALMSKRLVTPGSDRYTEPLTSS